MVFVAILKATAAKHPTLREAIIYSVAGPKICLAQVLSSICFSTVKDWSIASAVAALKTLKLSCFS